jgi:hypothetical protein
LEGGKHTAWKYSNPGVELLVTIRVSFAGGDVEALSKFSRRVWMQRPPPAGTGATLAAR